MEGWCKERHNKDENNKLEGLHQRPDQMEDTRWEGQNFPEVVAPEEEEEEEEEEDEEVMLCGTFVTRTDCTFIVVSFMSHNSNYICSLLHHKKFHFVRFL